MFIDTIVVCTMTALVVLLTGALYTGATGAELASTAFSTGLPGPGGLIVLAGLVLFSYTTMLTWCFYGEKSWEYIFGKGVVIPYRLIFLGFLYIGAIGGLVLPRSRADSGCGNRQGARCESRGRHSHLFLLIQNLLRLNLPVTPILITKR